MMVGFSRRWYAQNVLPPCEGVLIHLKAYKYGPRLLFGRR